MAERAQVALFLELMRECASCSFRLERRSKNMATLARLGLTLEDAKSRVLALTTSDYVEGPVPRSGTSSQEAWVFGIVVERVPVYVKVSVRVEPARCLCISFHEAECPMRFPFAESTRGVDGR